MTIHTEHPFLPADAGNVARRFRGRLWSPVTLWTAGADTRRAGLTVSSVMVALGEPAHVLGLIDPESDLMEVIRTTQGFVVAVLEPGQSELAAAFGGQAPAPGGLFAQAAFVQTPWGPRPKESGTWLGARVVEVDEVGWSAMVRGTVEHISVGDGEALAHRRGRYTAP